MFNGRAGVMLCGVGLTLGTLFMKLICILLGLALIATAGIYFVTPADSLPGFFPGSEAGLTRVHVKHGMVAAVAGLVLLAIGWVVGRH